MSSKYDKMQARCMYFHSLQVNVHIKQMYMDTKVQ